MVHTLLDQIENPDLLLEVYFLRPETVCVVYFAYLLLTVARLALVVVAVVFVVVG